MYLLVDLTSIPGLDETPCPSGGHVGLTSICDTFIETKEMPLTKLQWSYEREMATFGVSTLGSCPCSTTFGREESVASRLSSILGSVTRSCAPSVGINRDVIDDKGNDFSALSHEEWVEELPRLIGDFGLRVKMGRVGREKIMEYYTVEKCAPVCIAWMKNLL